MKESMDKFKSDFGRLRERSKVVVIGGVLVMTFIGLVDLSFVYMGRDI